MRPRVKAKLAHHRAMLVGEMKPLPMFGSLIENNVLTPAHLDKVLPGEERKELNEKLLDIIPTRGDAAFTVLGEGLEASLQGHLAYLLDPEGKEDPDEKKEGEEDGKDKKTSPKKKIGQLTRQISRMGSRSSMRPESRDQLATHKATLVSEMQPLPLFGLLIQNNILSRDMVDSILSPDDEKKINERLVDILPERPDSAYKMFIYALRGNGQGQLVDVLEGDIKPAKYRRDSDTGVDKKPARMSRDSLGAAKTAFESVYGSKENLLDDGKKKPVNPGPGWQSTATTPNRSTGSRPSSRPASTSKDRTASQSSEDGETTPKRKLSEYSATPPRQEMDWKNVERDNEDLRRRRSSIDARNLTMIRTGMKVKQRQLIFANRPAIVDSIQLDSVLDHMVKEGEFTQSQADELRKMPFRFSRNSRFVDLLLTKGSHNYNAFCDALKESDQLELARVMEPGRWTGKEYSPAKLPPRKDEPVETTPKKKWKPSSLSEKSPATKRRELQEKYGAADSVPDVRLEALKRKAKEKELREKAVATELEKDKKMMKDVGVGKTPPPVRKSQAVPPVEKHIETEETRTEKLPTLAKSLGEDLDGHDTKSKLPKSPPKDVKRKSIPERSAFIMKPDSPPPEVVRKTPSPPPKVVEKTPSPTREVVMKTPSPPPQVSPKLKAEKKERRSPEDLTFSPKSYGIELESPSPAKKPVPLKTLPKTPSPPPEVLLDSPKSPPKSHSRPTVELVFEDEDEEVDARPVTIGQVLDERKRKLEEIRLRMQERKKSLKREDEENNIKIVAGSNSSSPLSNGESVKNSERGGSEDTDEGVDVTTPQSPKRIPPAKIEEIGKGAIPTSVTAENATSLADHRSLSSSFPTTGPFPFPAPTGPFPFPAPTGPFTFPAPTGPFAFPAATDPLTIPAASGPFAIPAASGPFAIPAASGPFAIPAATGPFAFPAASGPVTFPAPTGPFPIPAATDPFTFPATKAAFAFPTTKIAITTACHPLTCQGPLSATRKGHQPFIQVHPDEGIVYGETYGVEYELVEEEIPGEVHLVQYDYQPPSPPPLHRDDEILVSTTTQKSSAPPVNRAPSPPKENDYGVIFDYPELVTIRNVPSDRVPPPSPPEQTVIAQAEPVVNSMPPQRPMPPPQNDYGVIVDYPKLSARTASSTHAPPPPPSSITNSSKRSTPESYISEDFPPMMMEPSEFNALVAGTPSPAQYSPVVATPSGQKKKLGVSQEVYKSLNSLTDLRKTNGRERRRRNTDSPPVIVDQVYGRPIKVLPTTMDNITPETERQMKEAAVRIAKSERLLQVMKQLSDRTLSHACQCEKLEDLADKDMAELVQTGTTVRPGGDILIDKLSDELQDLYKQRPGVFNKQPGPWYMNVNTAMRDTYNTLIIHLVHMKASLNDLSKAMEEYKKDNQLKNAYLDKRKEDDHQQ
uniref:CARD domain-containing protein n=1 Tax=Branchiostoma floridae TaxID=7739 RepID=C3YGB3_BRAFL|eukprot:XP_002604623.1 hypothetical protein BRAFLDRAFT_126782 [Branchiostoma floridae]